MKTQDLIFQFLQQQGLVPTKEEYGICFKYQMGTFIIINDESDEQFLQIIYPGMFDLTPENRVDALEAMNTVNGNVKVAKVCTWAENSVSIFVELLLDKTPNLEDIIPRSLNIILHTKQQFFEVLNG